MKKSILNLGKVLNKTEQKNVLGGLEDFKIDGNCYSNTVYLTPCPFSTDWSGCWTKRTSCGGGLN